MQPMSVRNADMGEPTTDPSEAAFESTNSTDRIRVLAVYNMDIEALPTEESQLKAILPALMRLLLNPSFAKRQQLLKLLYSIKKSNCVMQLTSVRNADLGEPNTVPPLTAFESANPTDRIRIVAAEYLGVQELVRQSVSTQSTSLKLIKSDLFDNQIYLDDVSYCLYMILTNSALTLVTNILDICETLLHLKFGVTYITRLLANVPESCQEVCHHLITNGEKFDEGAQFNEVSDQRAETLRLLCLMNPSIAFTVRSLTLQMCKVPSLTIMITIDHLTGALEKYNEFMTGSSSESCMDIEDSDEHSQAIEELGDSYDSAISFITGILLGFDSPTRAWFAQYIKSAQLKRIDHGHFSTLSKLRSHILACMNRLFSSLLEDERPTSESDDAETPPDRSIPKNSAQLNRKIIRATATLRFFCAIRGIGSLKLNPEESEILLRLVTCRPPANQTSVNFATTGVCTLLACSAMINNQKDERRAAEWLKWLIKESNYSDSRYSSHGKCSISELLLLIAIHFQNNQINQIAELVCATVGMKLQIRPSVSKCKSLFVQEVFTDQMVAEHAVKVPVTKNLSDDIKEFLPVHCIHQLLESRSFSKHQVPIKDWIFTQICESKKPIHHILPELIEAYVNSVIISTSAHGHCGTNQPIPEDDIARVFKTKLYCVDTDNQSASSEHGVGENARPEKKRVKKEKLTESNSTGCVTSDAEIKTEPKVIDHEAAQILLLYYLVLYDDIRLKKNPDLSKHERSEQTKYSDDFMMEIPIFYLLQLARDNQHSFGAILPDLLKLVTSQYPQLCSIQHWLTDDHYVPSGTDIENSLAISIRATVGVPAVNLPLKSLGGAQNAPINRANLLKQLLDGFSLIEEQPAQLARTMGNILNLPKEEVWPFADPYIENWSKLFGLDTASNPDYKKLIKISTKLWWKLNTIFPRKLWVLTVNSLKRPQSQKIQSDLKSLDCTWDELALDPLIVLRCDSRVFRCVETLNIVLHILSAFLAASRRCLQDQINEQPNRQKDSRNLEELRTTLVLAQASAAIQILLESCLPTTKEQEAICKRESGRELEEHERLLLDRLDACVDCICEHLHQVFIADTNLAKLVHFQTYPSELLATTSDKIPSMHICLDFIPELLSQPDLTKQVFVVELASHLCEKYAITKSLNVAKLCFNVAYTLLQLLPSERRAVFFIPVLPALLRICNVFPILREDADIILAQINQITMARLASTSSRLSLGSAQPFEGLEDLNWRETRKLMNTFSSHEALHLCIQKCILGLNQMKKDKKHIQPMSLSAPMYNSIFAYGNHVMHPSGS